MRRVLGIVWRAIETRLVHQAGVIRIKGKSGSS
jgi:hypothetical protein